MLTAKSWNWFVRRSLYYKEKNKAQRFSFYGNRVTPVFRNSRQAFPKSVAIIVTTHNHNHPQIRTQTCAETPFLHICFPLQMLSVSWFNGLTGADKCLHVDFSLLWMNEWEEVWEKSRTHSLTQLTTECQIKKLKKKSPVWRFSSAPAVTEEIACFLIQIYTVC